MNNNFDFNSKKYIILLILICLVFAVFIIKAFDYLPDNDVDTNDIEVENINTTASNTNPSPITIDTTTQKVQKSGVLYKSSDSYDEQSNQNYSQVDEIDAPSGVGEDIVPNVNIENQNTQLSPDLIAMQSIINAKDLASKGNDADALEEYKKALNTAANNQIKADAYEGISILYAKNKKYGTALSFASKAYEMAPSYTTDLLIAKIYYSAGKTDTAISRINNILKKGFN